MPALDDLIAALDDADNQLIVTSFRQPRALTRALTAAVELGWAADGDDGQNQALRAQLEAFAQQAALDAYYAEHPEASPRLAEVALALAQLDHDPLAEQPQLLEVAAQEVLEVRPDADAGDVLLWATSLQRHGLG